MKVSARIKRDLTFRRRSPNNNKDRIGETEKEAFSFVRNPVQELAKIAIRISEIRSDKCIGVTQLKNYLIEIKNESTESQGRRLY